MSNQEDQVHHDHILIVADDGELRRTLSDLLISVGEYQTSEAVNFEDALDQLLVSNFSLALVEVQLPDLSGIDLLTAVGILCPHVPVILIDSALSAKSAVAAFRLGAVDYLSKPINLDFILMRIDRELKMAHRPYAAAPPETAAQKHYTPEDRERRLDPSMRPAALILRRAQFKQITAQLEALSRHVRAKFVGLMDADKNMIGAAGTLEEYDLMLLKKALSFDHSANTSLLSVLGETSFHSTRFEGEHYSVYIIEFSEPHAVSLVVMCPVDVKPGIAWHYSKRTAVVIDKIIKSVRARGKVTAIQPEGQAEDPELAE
ncbi:MAG: response regulator [Anaerolineae bacterium]|nr:response regulator [Anaerolineae bacterium]